MIFFLGGFAVGIAITGAISFYVSRKRRHKISKFLAFAGHEMNTPATALRLTTLNFLEGVFGDLPSEQKSWLEVLNEQVGRLASLIGELRDFVHMEMGDDLSLRIQPSNVRDIVDEARLSIRRGLEQSGLLLEDEVPDNLPQVFVDFDRSVRVLSSLLFYARKFFQSGPFLLSAVAENQWVDLSVRFTPHSITKEELLRSLDLFYPAALAHSPMMKSTGFGLGFARHLMRAQGGEMIVSLTAEGVLSLKLRLPRQETIHGR